MDFNVVQPIKVLALGIFDSGQNGIKNNIDCILYNRDTQLAVATIAFSPTNMGTTQFATNFLDLPAPLILPAGFHGSIVAQGYGISEPNGSHFPPPLTPPRWTRAAG